MLRRDSDKYLQRLSRRNIYFLESWGRWEELELVASLGGGATIAEGVVALKNYIVKG